MGLGVQQARRAGDREIEVVPPMELEMSCCSPIKSRTLIYVTFLKISFYRKPRRIFRTVLTSHIH